MEAPGADEHSITSQRRRDYARDENTSSLASPPPPPSPPDTSPSGSRTPAPPRVPREAPRRPQQEAPGGFPGRPQEAPGGLPHRPPSGGPQEAPRGPRRPQEAPGAPRRAQEAAGGPRSPWDITGREGLFGLLFRAFTGAYDGLCQILEDTGISIYIMVRSVAIWPQGFWIQPLRLSSFHLAASHLF